MLGIGNVLLTQRIFLSKVLRSWYTDVKVNMYEATGLAVSGTSININQLCDSSWCYQQTEVPPGDYYTPLNLNSPQKSTFYLAADGTTQVTGSGCLLILSF